MFEPDTRCRDLTQLPATQSLNLLAATMLLFVNEEQAFWYHLSDRPMRCCSELTSGHGVPGC